MDEEIKEEVLDNPLVVHKTDDASYKDTASDMQMQTTHTDDDSDVPTLERHRFKREKKKRIWPYILLALLVVVSVVVAVLVNNGTISIKHKETTTQPKKSYTSQAENPFKDTITVKGTYLFYEGTEIDGIKELDREIKYLDKGTKFIIQDENANNDFLNFEVLSLLSDYSMDYEITHIVSSGLISKYETTAPPETETSQSTEAKPASTETPAQ